MAYFDVVLLAAKLRIQWIGRKRVGKQLLYASCTRKLKECFQTPCQELNLSLTGWVKINHYFLQIYIFVAHVDYWKYVLLAEYFGEIEELLVRYQMMKIGSIVGPSNVYVLTLYFMFKYQGTFIRKWILDFNCHDSEESHPCNTHVPLLKMGKLM
jgi:hypothetical protein